VKQNFDSEGRTRMESETYCIVDIETTGYGSRGNKVTEISAFKYHGNKVVDEFYSLVNPESLIPYNISRLTGITNETVMHAPKFFEIAKEFLLFTEGCVFVAHNVSFDYNTIRSEYSELGGEFRRKKLCTVRLARKILPGHQSYSLGKLCDVLGIVITDRHRARGDAEATVVLFEMLMKKDDHGIIEYFLSAKSKETSIPPLLKKETYENLPNQTGIYYFLNTKGEIIYVGKAIDIKKRVLSHFQDKKKKEVVMQQMVSDLQYEITGSELVALLLESSKIKKLRPTYNSAQKRTNEGFGIFIYEDGNRIMRLAYGNIRQVKNPLARFYNISDARSYLERVAEQFELCPKYCGLQKSKGGCFHFQIQKCRGVCARKEEIEDYNKRVQKAVESMQLKEDFVIIGKGPTESEKSVVLVEGGIYKGFGYFDKSNEQDEFNFYSSQIKKYSNNSDVQRIIKWHLNKSENQNGILFKKKEKMERK